MADPIRGKEAIRRGMEAACAAEEAYHESHARGSALEELTGLEKEMPRRREEEGRRVCGEDTVCLRDFRSGWEKLRRKIEAGATLKWAGMLAAIRTLPEGEQPAIYRMLRAGEAMRLKYEIFVDREPTNEGIAQPSPQPEGEPARVAATIPAKK